MRVTRAYEPMNILSSNLFSCPHITPRPGTPGKVFWLSGPPGAGKSTTCQLMAREKGYRYFEADCTMNLVNPFTDIHVDNPSMASFQAKSLKVPKSHENRNKKEQTRRLQPTILDNKMSFIMNAIDVLLEDLLKDISEISRVSQGRTQRL